jgi:hypothetical protein
MALLERKLVGRRRWTERERYGWRPGSDAIDTVAQAIGFFLTGNALDVDGGAHPGCLLGT